MTTTLTDLIDATWPAAATHAAGPWLVREGRGGGKRVSAATAATDWTEADIVLAETAQAALGQPALFMVRDGEERLDAVLDRHGYRMVDPVVVWSAPVGQIAGEVPHLGAFALWPPLAVQTQIWAEDGITSARVAVMERVACPKTALLGRVTDRPAGAGFAAIHGGTVMIHALTVSKSFRRKGCAVNMLRAAANWAQSLGATDFALVVTRGNLPANSLYASLGMQIVGHYHYREKQPVRGA